MVQFPKRRETDLQAEERIERLKLRNEAQGCNVHGQPVDKEDPSVALKNLTDNERKLFLRFRI